MTEALALAQEQVQAMAAELARIRLILQEVLALVGKPFERRPGEAGTEVWRWTRSPHHASYGIRGVVFEQGRVVESSSSFSVD